MNRNASPSSVYLDQMEHMKHHFIEVEDSILAVLCFRPDAFREVSAMIKTAEVFYNGLNKATFMAMQYLDKHYAAIDAASIAKETKRIISENKEFSGLDDGQIYWHTIKRTRDVVLTTSHLPTWCAILLECYYRRVKFMQRQQPETSDVFADMERTNEQLREIMNLKAGNDWSDMSQLMLTVADRREKVMQGVQFGVLTGFRELDEVTGGFDTGMHIICARPSMGKTALAMSMILNMIQAKNKRHHQYRVGLISLEMPNVQLAARIVSSILGIPFAKVFRDADQQTDDAILARLPELSTLPLYVSDETKTNIGDIRHKAEKLVRSHGANILFIDYLQLIEVDSKNGTQRYVQMGELSRGLKLLSKTLDIPIIALAQVNRESETSDGGKIARISQLRESGSFEQDMDLGIVIDRPFKRGLKTNEIGQSTENMALIDIQKHRNGDTRTIEIEFAPEFMRFQDKAGYFPSDSPTITSNFNRTTPPNLRPLANDPNDLPF